MAHLAMALLGEPQLALDGVALTDLATDKARALLYYLALEPDVPHRREMLAGLLWPDQPEGRARQNLRQVLSYLRQALGSEAASFLLVSHESLQFNRDSAYSLDVTEFLSLLGECRAHRHRRLGGCGPCLERLRRAVHLYRGDLLSGFSLADSDLYEEWMMLKREWLRREAVQALALLAGYHERRGEYREAREYACRQVELEPWREEAQRRLLQLLALSGERDAALAQYVVCRQVLAVELGVEPAAETVALYERLRAGEELPPPGPGHSLPAAPGPVVGWEHELAELAALLGNADCRLVTLTGPAGSGKTRLAVEAAARARGTFSHGVWFVPLVGCAGAEGAAAAIAAGLRLAPGRGDPRARVLDYVRGKELLLLLDGLGPESPGVDLVAEMLASAPGVVLLVTAREPLSLQEEWVYEVHGPEAP